MASLSLPTPAEGRAPQPTAPATTGTEEGAVLVAGFGNPVAVDYAEYVGRQGGRCVADRMAEAPARVAAIVLFLPPRLTDRARRELDEALALARDRQAEFIG